MGKDLKGRELGKGLSQRKDGRYSARFVKKNGKRAEKYFWKLPEAKKWLINAKYEDEHCTISSSSKMTVDTWFNYWIDNIEAPLVKQQTAKRHKDRYRLHISSKIGYMIISEVKPMHCQSVLNAMLESDYEIGTINLLRSTMHAFFSAAVDNDIIDKNPVKKSVTVKKDPLAKEKIKVLSIDEQKKFLLYINNVKRAEEYEIYSVILETGLRIGEAMALSWNGVNFKDRSIYINSSMQYSAKRKKFEIDSPKSPSGYRSIPMTQRVYDILWKIKERRKKNVLLQMEYKDLVFLNRKGIPIKNTTHNSRLYAVADKTGIEHLTPHVLRHTFATRCIEAGMRPQTLQKILGHSTIHMTMIYVHLLKEEKVKEMEKLELYLNCNVAKMA